MTEQKQVRLGCIASGNGTDFESIAKAWKAGWIPEVSEVVLISTKEGAGCIEKAKAQGINYEIVMREENLLVSVHNQSVRSLSTETLGAGLQKLGGVDLIFLVGCIVYVPDLILPMYNIHPADPHMHGGQGMYGLAVHLHVLAEIKDLWMRGMVSVDDRFFTAPSVHVATSEYDCGQVLLQVQVEIPQALIEDLVDGSYEGIEEDAAKKLQQIVLPYEWMMLPCAVRLAAQKILDQEKG